MTRRPVPLAVGGLAVLAVVVLLAFNAPALLSTATTYRADFTEAAGLQAGDQVTIAGVAAGRVGAVALDGDHVRVTFAVEDAWVGDQTTASIQIRTLLGAKYLESRAALVDVQSGEGHIILFGMRPQFRAQSYQAFKLFFNSLLLSSGRK